MHQKVEQQGGYLERIYIFNYNKNLPLNLETEGNTDGDIIHTK